MKKEVLEEYISEGLSLREIGEKVGLSGQGVWRYTKKYNLSTKKVGLTHLCKVCNEKDPEKFHNRNKTTCAKCEQRIWKRKRKQFAVDYLGGKCIHCGYNKYIEALDFHHINPDEKEYTICMMSTDIEKFKNELDKCILLCANCHREEHAKLRLTEYEIAV